MTQVTIDTDKLSRTIKELLASLKQFETILEKESTQLKTSNTDALNKITSDKDKVSSEIESIFTELKINTDDPEFSINNFMQQDLFANLPLGLQEIFAQVENQIVMCHDKNIANGISLQALNNINHTFLQLFKGQDPHSKTYTASGNTTPSSSTSKTLGKA